MKKGIEDTDLLLAVKQLIEQGKQKIAVSVNTTMSLLYWQIGKRINDDVLQNQRVEYGKQIVYTLCRELNLSHLRLVGENKT